MLDKLTLNDFTGRIGETFDCQLEDDHSVSFDLVEATQRDSGAPEADNVRQAFSLVFSSPKEHFFEQNIFPLHHPELGNLEIFMVPIGEADNCIQYEAIFN